MSILVSSLSSAVGYAGYRIAASKWSPSTPRTGYKWVSVPQWGIWKIHYEISIKSRYFLRVWEWLNLHFGKKHKKCKYKQTILMDICGKDMAVIFSKNGCRLWGAVIGWVGHIGFLGIAGMVRFKPSPLSNPWGFHLCHRMNRKLPSTMMDFDV